MADQKVTDLTAVVTPDDTDVLVAVQDVATTPVSKKITWTVIKAFLRKFATGEGFFDENGNEQIVFTTAASAVNYLEVKNSATGVDVEIQATGDDTIVDLLLTPKGSTGTVLAKIENNTAAVVNRTAPQTLANKDISAASNTYRAASPTVDGSVELATIAEINTGTDTGRAVTPDGLAGANIGIRYVQMIVKEFATDIATGDGAFYFHIPAGLDGMNLVEVHAEVITVGTTGTSDFQLHNVDNALDMLSTKLTIDSAEAGSDTAATAAVINASNDHVNENDVIRVDIDAVSTVAPKGLIVTMGFQLP